MSRVNSGQSHGYWRNWKRASFARTRHRDRNPDTPFFFPFSKPQKKKLQKEASSEIRTRDLTLTERMLCQLSYRGYPQLCVNKSRDPPFHMLQREKNVEKKVYMHVLCAIPDSLGGQDRWLSPTRPGFDSRSGSIFFFVFNSTIKNKIKNKCTGFL